jgi:hypothetical protein
MKVNRELMDQARRPWTNPDNWMIPIIVLAVGFGVLAGTILYSYVTYGIPIFAP